VRWSGGARNTEEARQLTSVSRLTCNTLVLTTVALAVIAIAAPPSSAQSAAAAQAAPAQLVDLHDLSELRARFNADAGFTRLVLLVSPT
jgi:hypothetical protein